MSYDFGDDANADADADGGSVRGDVVRTRMRSTPPAPSWSSSSSPSAPSPPSSSAATPTDTVGEEEEEEERRQFFGRVQQATHQMFSPEVSGEINMGIMCTYNNNLLY